MARTRQTPTQAEADDCVQAIAKEFSITPSEAARVLIWKGYAKVAAEQEWRRKKEAMPKKARKKAAK